MCQFHMLEYYVFIVAPLQLATDCIRTEVVKRSHVGGWGISLAHGCIVEEVHKGVYFTCGSCYDVCGMQTNKSVTYLFTYTC